MTPLLRYFSWRYIRRHPFRVLLSLLSVALGVALFVSVDVSNTSAEAAFRRTVDRLAGNAQLQVIRSRSLGVEEEVLAKLDAIPGIKAAPVLQLGSSVPGSGESLLVLGMDFQRETAFRRWEPSEGEKPQVNPLAFLMRDAVVVTKAFAAKQKLKLGGSFRIDTPEGPRPVVIAAVVPDEGAAQVFGGNVVVMHVKTAQRLFKRPGRFDRIEVVVAGDVEAAARRIREALGPEVQVQPPARNNSFLDEALTRMKALLGISVIALLVGVFIIYNSVAISVVERVKEIGILRSIGATRGEVFRVILLEWSLVGVLGSALGIAIGVALAQVLLRMTAGEVNQLMLVVDVGEIALLPRTVALGLALGTSTAFIAAYFPGRQAMSISPVEMLRQGVLQVRSGSGYGRSLVVGLLFIAFAVAATARAFSFENVGLAAAFFAFLGAALVLPQVTIWTLRAARPVMGRCFRLGGALAADNLAKAPQRTALTVIALSGALAMMVCAAAIIVGFKVRQARWLHDALPFDCQVTASNYEATIYGGARLPAEIPAIVGGVEGVDFSYSVVQALQDYGERDIMVFGLEMASYARMQALRGGVGLVKPGTLADLQSGKGVVASENFAGIHGVKVGHSFELRTRKGVGRFVLLGTFEDYTWPQGSVYIDLPVYRELWEDPGISYLEVRFKEGFPRAEVRKRIVERIKGESSLFVYDVEDFRRIGDEMLDRTLKFTNVQVAVSMIIGFLGIVNTLLISVMRRTREIGLLRAVGMTRRQVAEMVVIESVFIALVGGVLGVGLGLAAAKWPVALHVFQIMGYTLPLEVPWASVALAMGGALAIGVVASILPARRATSLNVLEAITYE
ncbi:MAG TPA: FtsX-like permease family protein [Planctomycetota bacterium]|nr:FtsX-like permease family protein [Planctomycetota bacterium]